MSELAAGISKLKAKKIDSRSALEEEEEEEEESAAMRSLECSLWDRGRFAVMIPVVPVLFLRAKRRKNGGRGVVVTINYGFYGVCPVD